MEASSGSERPADVPARSAPCPATGQTVTPMKTRPPSSDITASPNQMRVDWVLWALFILPDHRVRQRDGTTKRRSYGLANWLGPLTPGDHAISLRSPSQSPKNPRRWFQLRIVGVTGPEIRNGLGAFMWRDPTPVLAGLLPRSGSQPHGSIVTPLAAVRGRNPDWAERRSRFRPIALGPTLPAGYVCMDQTNVLVRPDRDRWT